MQDGQSGVDQALDIVPQSAAARRHPPPPHSLHYVELLPLKMLDLTEEDLPAEAEGACDIPPSVCHRALSAISNSAGAWSLIKILAGSKTSNPGE